MMKNDLAGQIIQPLYPLVQDIPEIEDIIITSGRAGAKTSGLGISSVYIASAMATAQVIMRKNKNKLRNTVYPEIKRAFTRLGIPSNFAKFGLSPLYIEMLTDKQSKIYFAGSDNPDDTKGMIDEDFPISRVYVDEVSEFFAMGYEKGKEELDNIKATFVRGNGSDFKMVYLFNPPKNVNAPVMKWLNEKKYLHDEEGNVEGLNPRTLHIHTTYEDVPVEWLGQRLIDSALETKRMDEEYYNWLWLGESVGVKDVIFHMFDRSQHIVDYKKERLQNIVIGVDYGQMNATTFNAIGFDLKSNRFHAIKNYTHSGRDSNRQKSPSEYAKDMYDFVMEVEAETGELVKALVIDPSATGFAEEIKRYFNSQGKAVAIIKANNTVDEGIARVQTLLTYQALVFDSSMEAVFQELEQYRYDEKSIERGDEKPIKDFDHSMDGIRYAIMYVYNTYKRRLKLVDEKT